MYQLELYLTWHVSRRHPGHMPRPHADEASRSEPTSQRHACHANEPRFAEVAREGYALKASKCASGIKACCETTRPGGHIPAEAVNVCERDALKQARNARQYVHPLSQTDTSQKETSAGRGQETSAIRVRGEEAGGHGRARESSRYVNGRAR